MATAACACSTCGSVCKNLTPSDVDALLGRGVVEAALRRALEETLKTGSVPESLVEGIMPAVARYAGPFTAGRRCRVCAAIHSGDSVLQRHRRCLLHVASGHACRSVRIRHTVHVRGNEAIVGLEYGTTRDRPEGDLRRIEALTRAAAFGVARAVVARIDELYDGQESQTGVPALADLVLRSEYFVWRLRLHIESLAAEQPGALPDEAGHVDVPGTAAPPAPVPPVLPPLTEVPENAPPPATAVREMPSGRKRPVPGGATLASSVGSLKQRILRAATPAETEAVSAAFEAVIHSPRYPSRAAPNVALFPNDKQKLYYLIDRLWAACKRQELAEEDFRELLGHCAAIGKAVRRGASLGKLA